MPPELLDRLHGTVRYLRQVTGYHRRTGGRSDEPAAPWWDPAADASVDPETDSVVIGGVTIAKGSRVRLAPRLSGTDAQDMFLAGMSATVQAVVSDVDGSQHMAVTDRRGSGRRAAASPGPLPLLRPDRVGADRAAVDDVAAVSAMMILVAGIGNIFFADDGFGVEVAQRLARRARCRDGVKVVDYGIRGMHLAYDMLAGYDVTILVDAVPRGDEPGTVYVIDVTAAGTDALGRPANSTRTA